MKKSENIQKLMDAENEGKKIIQQANEQAERIKSDAEIKISEYKRETGEFIEHLHKSYRSTLEDELQQVREKSAQRVEQACSEIEKKMAEKTKKAIEAVLREIV